MHSGFWQKIDTYEEQPDVHFHHDLLAMLETNEPNEAFGWSTMTNFNRLLNDKIRTPQIKVRSNFVCMCMAMLFI